MHLLQARAFLANIQPGQSVVVPLLDRQPANRMAQQALNQAAHGMWGAGWYSMKSERDPCRVIITRLSEHRSTGARRRYEMSQPILSMRNEWGSLRREYQQFLDGDSGGVTP